MTTHPQLKEKMETMKETRRIAHKLGSVETLGAQGKGEELDVKTWVQQMRAKDEERKLAEQRVGVCHGNCKHHLLLPLNRLG